MILFWFWRDGCDFAWLSPLSSPLGSFCHFSFLCTDRQLMKAGALQQAGGQGLITQLLPSSQSPYSSSCQRHKPKSVSIPTSPATLAARELEQSEKLQK